MPPLYEMKSLSVRSRRHSLTDVNQEGKSAKDAVKRAQAVYAEYGGYAAARLRFAPAEV